MATPKNPYGKHPIYLNMPHELYQALEAYRKKMGVPRSRIIFGIIKGFLGPLTETPLGEDEE